MKYAISHAGSFKSDLKAVKKRGYNIELLENIVTLLADGQTLPPECKDHQLISGKYKYCRECHILPDWLLIYRYLDSDLILYLTRTGTHSDLF